MFRSKKIVLLSSILPFGLIKENGYRHAQALQIHGFFLMGDTS